MDAWVGIIGTVCGTLLGAGIGWRIARAQILASLGQAQLSRWEARFHDIGEQLYIAAGHEDLHTGTPAPPGLKRAQAGMELIDGCEDLALAIAQFWERLFDAEGNPLTLESRMRYYHTLMAAMRIRLREKREGIERGLPPDPLSPPASS